MEYNDYVIAFDENGTPYIAHAGFMDGARNAVNAAANRVQQVANNVKGVGRGVRQNHKYILKVNENGKTRYFYKQEEVKAYYEAKKRGIKNAAEYAQNAVKNKASEVADKAKQGISTAKNAVREATGQAARDRMDAAVSKHPELATNQESAYQAYKKAQKEADSAEVKYNNARLERNLAEDKASNSNIFNRKRRETNAQSARDQEEQYRSAWNKSLANEAEARGNADRAIKAYTKGMDEYLTNKAAYDKSLAGAVDRTAAKARDTANDAKEAASSAYNKAKDSANNTVKNAKDRFERMKGEFRDRAEQAGNAVKSTAKNAVDKAKDIAGYDEKERLDKATENKQSTKDAARKGEQYVTDVLNESPPGHRTQTQIQRLNAAVGVRNERWNAEDQARDEYWRARADYDKTPLAMVNRAKAQVSSAADSVRDKAEEAVEKLSSIPKAAKAAAEDAAFNVEYYSKQLKDGITGEKAAKAAASIREEVKDWKARADGVTNKELKDFYEQKANQAENLAKRFDEEAAKSVKGRINSATNSVQGMIDQARTAVKDKAEDLSAKAKSTAQAAKESAQGMIENARSSTAKAVNEAWDKIPKNADGTVNPFDSNFQSAYNDWKSKKEKYDGSLTGQAKAVAEKATDSVKDMIDQAKKAAKNAATSAQNTIDNVTGESYRKQAQEANRAAEHAMNELFRTSDQLENQRSKYGSQHNDSEHIYGDSEGYYYKTEAQRDIAENMIKRRDQYSADIVNNNTTSNTLDNRYAKTKAGQLNKLLGRDISSTSSRTNGAADAIKAVRNLEDAKSKLVGGRIEPNSNVSKEYVYARASNSGMAGTVSKVMKLEEAMRDAERAYDRLGNDTSKPQSSSKAARQKMLQAQDAYEKAYEELIDDINKQYDQDLAAYEKQYGKYNR